jgi:hypothetical protein
MLGYSLQGMGLLTYHKYTPEDDEADDVHGCRSRSESLGKGGENDDDQLESIHLLSAHDIGHRTEAKLADNSTTL